MISRESILSISELKADNILQMVGESEFSEYCEALKKFTDDYPKYAAELKSAFTAHDASALTEILSGIMHVLGDIYAYEAEKKCARLLSYIETESFEAVGEYFDYFVTSVSTLSIDLQMLMYKAEPYEENKPAQRTGEFWKILAVDDIPLILSILKTILKDTPSKLIGVTSGVAALKYMEKNDPDLFLLDIEMPGMNGYELAEKIRAAKKNAPIIFLTGNVLKEYVEKAVDAGAVDFIVKPVCKDQVLKKIGKYLCLN